MEIVCCKQEGKWVISWNKLYDVEGPECDPTRTYLPISTKGSMIDMGGLGGEKVEAPYYCIQCFYTNFYFKCNVIST